MEEEGDKGEKWDSESESEREKELYKLKVILEISTKNQKTK